MGASSSTSKILTPNPAPSQLISKMFQQPNVTQMYANKNIYSSGNSSQIQNLRIDPILHNQVNPHQPNVFSAPNSSNPSNQHQYQHQQHRYQIYSSGAISSHSSSSTVYNPSSAKPNKYAKTYQHFEYFHLLRPTLKDFRWHLKDEIFQLQQSKINNMSIFYKHMMHIKEGVQRNYPHCRLTRRKVILNIITTTITTTVVDTKLKTNVSRLPPVSKPAFKKFTTVEEDKNILVMEPKKFFQEFTQLLKSLDGKFHKSISRFIQIF